MLKSVGKVWTGPNKAHLPPQHVDQLWGLVKARFAKEPSRWSYSSILGCVESGTVAVPEIRRIDIHTAKLQHFEGPVIHANSFLAKENRAG
jgi:hypothetical protein